MTDIARPSNPALSFSSFNDEPVVGYRMKAYPDRIEILTPSPRTTITAGSLGTLDDGRSKSAPPNPANTREEQDEVEDITVLSSTYDPHRHGRGRLDGNPDVGQTDKRVYHRNPDIVHVLRTGDAGAAVAVLTANEDHEENAPIGAGGITFLTDPRAAHTNAVVVDSPLPLQSKQQEDPTKHVDGRQLSRPIPQTASQLSSVPLILRPNPVKAAEITTTHLSSSELVRAVATATSGLVESTTATLYPHQEERVDDDSSEGLPSGISSGTPAEEKKANENWCDKASSEVEKQVKRERKQAIEQRKHEIQVDFPDNTANLVMPPSVFSGEVEDYEEAKSNGQQNTSDGAQKREAQQQHHRDRMNSLRASSGGGSSMGNRNRNGEDVHPESGAAAGSVQPTPLFERLVTEEVQELKTYAGIVERQNLELAKQKKVQEDLEARLRGETRRRKELESLLEEQERIWSEKFVELEEQRNEAEKKLHEEQTKTKKLINQVQRKDRDIHDFFKKKVRCYLVIVPVALRIVPFSDICFLAF